MARLRRRESAARAATTASGADWTQYVIVTPTGETEPLRKRRAILALVHALAADGVPAPAMEEVIPGPRFLSVQGTLDGQELAGAFVATYPNAHERERRWFLDQPLHDGDRTWVLSKMWGTNTVSTLEALMCLASEQGFGFRPVTQ